MKVTTERLPDSLMVLNIELETDEVEESLQKTYKKLVQRVRVPGFRPGKAPRAILRSFVGKDVFLDEALEDLLPDVVKRAVEEQKIETVDAPKVEVTQRSPVVVKATVALKPTVELGDYQSIRVEPEPVETSPEQVDEALEALRYRSAPWEPAERPVALGDLVTIDVEGVVDGKAIINDKGVTYRPTRESTYPVAGFALQLENMEASRTKEFSLTLPDDYPDEGLAGKECRFTVMVHEIKEKNPPPLDDDFARSVDAEYESLEMLREKLASDFREHATVEAERKYEDNLIEALKAGARIEVPPNLREHEIDHLIMDEAGALAARGVKFENYLKAIDKTVEEYRQSFQEVADKRVTNSLLLQKLADVENITVEEKEIEEEIKALEERAAERGSGGEGGTLSDEGRSLVENRILMRKALTLLKDIAGREAVPAIVVPGPVPPTTETREVENET